MVGKHVHDQGGMVEGTCPGLVEGNQYMFRIKAVNIGTTILILISSSTGSNYIWTICSKGSSKKKPLRPLVLKYLEKNSDKKKFSTKFLD